jgi:predicted regulator of Ras-like GTPase activity (Roadblock/LC7/MglB family)
MIKSFLLITKDGTPLFIHNHEQDSFDNTLVSCFLSAIQSFAKEIGDSSIDKIEMQANTFYYASKGPIFSIVIADAKDEIESRAYKITAERISRAFLQKFSEDNVQERSGDIDFFSTFKEDYNSIIDDINNMLQQSHKDFISQYFAKAASDENIIGTIVFDLDKDEVIASDVPPDISAKSFESFSAMLFNFVDRLGKELKAGNINEILMKAKEFWIGGFRKGNLAVFMLFTLNFFGNVIPDIVHSAI